MKSVKATNKFYVYGLFVNSALIYVGKGCGARFRAHLQPSYLKRQQPLYCKLRSLLAQGVHPDVRLLLNNVDESDAFAWERILIAFHGRRIHGTGCLFNCTAGGEGTAGHIPSQATRKRLSDSHLGLVVTHATRQKLSKALIGRTITWGGKISATRKQSRVVQAALRKLAMGRRKELLALDPNSQQIMHRFTGRNVASKAGFNRGGIHASITNPNRLYKGLKWQYAN